MKSQSFENGLTVRQLRELIKDWSDEDDVGNPCEIFIRNGNYTSKVRSVWLLSPRENEDGKKWADMFLDWEDAEFEDLEV